MAENPLKAAKKPAAKKRAARKKDTETTDTQGTTEGNDATENKQAPESAKKKDPGKYHVLEKIPFKELSEEYDGDVYVDLGQYKGVNADKAVDAYLDENTDIEEGTWVPVPTRHFKEQSIKLEPQPPKRKRS
jgi:hypothetical protein